MISISKASEDILLNKKRIIYYGAIKEISLIKKDKKFYLDEENYQKLLFIALFRHLGFSLDDIDELLKSGNLNKYLTKQVNLIPQGNKYEGVKKVCNILLEDKVNVNNLDKKKYLDLIKKLKLNGYNFYLPKEDLLYEQLKTSKFNLEYALMISAVSLFYCLYTLLSGGVNLFMSYFPFYFLGLLLTFVIFFIPIKLKYHKRVKNYFEEER